MRGQERRGRGSDGATPEAREWGLPDDGPYRGGRVHVLSAMCSTCVFRPGNPMRLRRGRVEEMVSEAVGNGSAIVCHATLPLPGRRAICRGFWLRHAGEVLALRLAQAWRVVTFGTATQAGQRRNGQEVRGGC